MNMHMYVYAFNNHVVLNLSVSIVSGWLVHRKRLKYIYIYIQCNCSKPYFHTLVSGFFIFYNSFFDVLFHMAARNFCSIMSITSFKVSPINIRACYIFNNAFIYFFYNFAKSNLANPDKRDSVIRSNVQLLSFSSWRNICYSIKHKTDKH